MFNPDRVLYGRLVGFGLSERGRAMAQAAADYLSGLERSIAALYSSPLQRAQESAAPIAELTGLEPLLDERLIEPFNRFEGSRLRGPGGSLRDPKNWWLLRNPVRPSWGEPFSSIAARMDAAMHDAAQAADEAGTAGDIVLVSHQLPIWMTHRAAVRARFAHDPRRRRCALSSVTSFERHGGRWVEVAYADPAAGLAADAVDVGAV